MALSIFPLHGQPAYEVVSIHRASPTETNSGFSDWAQGGIKARNITATQALLFAYGAHEFQLLGAPAWTRSDRFDITFTPAGNEKKIEESDTAELLDRWSRQRKRMQAVLKDRFNLILRAETREGPVYILKVAKNGPRLSVAAHPENHQTVNINTVPGGRRMIATCAPTSTLADELTVILGRSVRDETGLALKYDFTINWALDLVQDSAQSLSPELPQLPSMTTALTEQLGLRLESSRGQVPVLVVDKIERPSIEE